MSLDQAYPMVAEVAPRTERGRLTGAAVVAAVVLAIDAVLALAGTLVLELPVLLRASESEHRSEAGEGSGVVAVGEAGLGEFEQVLVRDQRGERRVVGPVDRRP
jgi:hypothetical protein